MPKPYSPRARVFRRSLMTLACVAAAPSWSQDVGSPDAQLQQRVEVTGSRIKQIDVEGASPVEIIKREDIVKTGATSVREMLDTLTVTSTNGATINDVNGSGTFAPGASQGSLRNLGAQSTLVLLNGRRLPTYPLPNFQETFTNLDAIPLDAVDRIEILKVGGSAVYGSDAIAGVINIITRRDFKGLEVGVADQASIERGKFGERSAHITGGVGDYDKNGWNVFGNIEFFHRDEVMWSSLLSQATSQYKQVSPSYGTLSSYSGAGYLDGEALTDCTGKGTLVGDACFYNRYQRFEAVPKTNRVNGILQANVKLGDSTDWHTDVLVSSIHSQYQNAYPTYGSTNAPVQWLNTTTGLQNTFYYRGLPLTNPLNNTGEDENTNDFRYRFTDAGSSEETNTTEYRLLTGLDGTWHDWEYKTAIGVMGAHSIDRQRGSYSLTGFEQEIGDPGHIDPDTGGLTPVSADFFNVPGGYVIGGNNSADVLNTLFPKFGSNGTYRQFFADGNVTHDIAQLPAGPLTLSLGAEVRHESMVLAPTQNLVDDDIVGLAQSQSNGSRNFGAIYSELGIPVIKNVNLGLAGRVDKFQGFAAHFSPRANLEYLPISDLKLRGTIETGFRAPNLQESAQSSKSAYQPGISDPQRCPAAQQVAAQYRAEAAADPDPGEAAVLLSIADQVQGNECNASVNVLALNNPDLKPEKSLSKSLGAVFQVAKHMNVTADWWSITRKNEINLKSVQDLLAAEGSNTNVITRTPLDTTGTLDPSFTGDQIAQYGITAGPIASVKLQYANLFETRTSGFDFGVGADTTLPIGKLSGTVNGTYTANYQVYSPIRNTTGGWGDNQAGHYGYPHWLINTSGTLQVGDVSQTIRWTHQSGTILQQDFDDTTFSPQGCEDQGLTAEECHVHSYNRFDYALEYTGIHNLTIGGNLINIFKQRPPFDARGFLSGGSGIIPTSNEDAQGRLLKVYLNYKFL